MVWRRLFVGERRMSLLWLERRGGQRGGRIVVMGVIVGNDYPPHRCHVVCLLIISHVHSLFQFSFATNTKTRLPMVKRWIDGFKCIRSYIPNLAPNSAPVVSFMHDVGTVLGQSLRTCTSPTIQPPISINHQPRHNYSEALQRCTYSDCIHISKEFAPYSRLLNI